MLRKKQKRKKKKKKKTCMHAARIFRNLCVSHFIHKVSAKMNCMQGTKTRKSAGTEIEYHVSVLI